MKPVIEIKQLGKKYRIRKTERYLSFRDTITNSAKNIFKKKEDNKQDFWAIHDIDLKVEQGERIGIIGNNGAGKSTLLKILSRITWPSVGEATIRGRLASLLEVGTGFHPELTGRENVYLNGSILGLKKAEIERQFDAIVDFSGVETFLDTPLKNYSTGMQLRLAFAVAAHLEPEILLIDEVLAVGDMEFQKKCLGKMEEVSSKQGRTILFVSHNMQALTQLCNRGLILQKGSLIYDGTMQEAVQHYLAKSIETTGATYDLDSLSERYGTNLVRFTRLDIFNNGQLSSNFVIGNDMDLRLSVKAFQVIKSLSIAIHIYRYDQLVLANIENIDSNFSISDINGEATFSIRFKDLNFYPGTYKLGFWIASTESQETHDHLLYCADFTILEGSSVVRRKLIKEAGILYLTPEWKRL